jgi:hypothetical protein
VADRTRPFLIRFAEAYGWGVFCGVAAAIAGAFGQLVGATLYPQRYEQIPSFLLFIPLGMIVGFVAAAAVRLARPQLSVAGMAVAAALIPLVYAALMFDYARANAAPPGITVTFDPAPGVARRCAPGECPSADPPMQWIVTGTMRVRERSGLEGTVDGVSLSSYTEEPPRRPFTLTRGDTVALSRFAGPNILLTGDQIDGERRVPRLETVAFPIRYTYRTIDGTSRRSIAVSVFFEDTAGRTIQGSAKWDVR